MMKQRYFLTIMLLALTFFSGCSVLQRPPLSAERLVITYGSKACFGQCPEMSVILNGDGRMTLQGNAYVDKIGAYHKQVPESSMRDFIKELEESAFFDLPSQPDTEYPDGAYQSMYIQLDDRSHTVEVRGEAPPAFNRVRSFIYQQVQGTGWAALDQDP